MAVEKASIAVEIVGFLLNKVRDWASNKLKDGDLTNEELRQVLVRDLYEINAKLDSLSLKDLDASRRFLKEGMSFLILALYKPIKNQETHKGLDEAADISTDGASGSLNAALRLPQAIQKLQTTSEKRFEEAKKCFQKAREDATHAFSNKSLNIKDRIMACKLRVAARIFETGLEDPEAAVSACLLALEDLHRLPAIKDMFEVFFSRGMRSWRNEAERLENIMSVVFINNDLFDFAAKCSSRNPDPYTWPKIELRNYTVHPVPALLHTDDTAAKTSRSEEFGQQLKPMIVFNGFSQERHWWLLKRRGKVTILDDGKATNKREREPIAFAVDRDGTVYPVLTKAGFGQFGLLSGLVRSVSLASEFLFDVFDEEALVGEN